MIACPTTTPAHVKRQTVPKNGSGLTGKRSLEVGTVIPISRNTTQRPDGAEAPQSPLDLRRVETVRGRFRQRASGMSRLSLMSNPMLLGFEEIERLIDRASKGTGDGYPPYNIERLAGGGSSVETLRITLAVAGFKRDELDVSVEDNQLTVRGKQEEDKAREYLYRGIAARQFARTFVLADGIEVRSADLNNGLLAIDLQRHEPQKLIRKIDIGQAKNSS
jgi:HSP20 family molecular chaperone IbpA